MRRFNVSGLAGWFVAAVVLVIGAGRSEEIRAKRLVIEDGEGRDRIIMQFKNDHPAIEFRTATGDTHMMIWLNLKGEGQILTVDGEGKAHVLP